MAFISIHRDKRLILRCPRCESKAGENRRLIQAAYDLPLGPAKIVQIHYEAIQGFCSKCHHYFTIRPPGIDMSVKATKRLMHYVCRLCRFMPVNKIEHFLPISTSTARRWDKTVLATHLPKVKYDDLRLILVDEKSIGAHHHYLTVVINAESGEVLHLAEGKKKESLESFFHKLTEKQIKKIVAVGMDRAGAYKAVVREYAPKADIVFDKFHLIANYNQVIDEIRRSEWQKANKENKTFIKGQRYNLFRNPENLKENQTASLNILFEANEQLFQAYLLKDALKHLWTYQYPKWAGKYLDQWISWAKETDLQPIIKFAKGLNRDRAEIISCTKHRITSAKLEAFNGVINRIVKKACGYRDLEYLYLKIRQEASPPVLQT